MNDAAPVSWLLGQLNELLVNALNGVSSQIASTVTPMAAACFGIYVILIAVNYARGAEGMPVYDFALRCAAWALVIGLGFSAAGYTGTVVPIIQGLGTDLANAASGGTLQEGALDKLLLTYLQIVSDAFMNADGVVQTIVVAVKAILVVGCLLPFVVVASLTLLASSVGLALIAAVGPIYFAFLLFPATRAWFTTWINAVWSFSLIPLFVATIAAVGVGLSQQMLGASLGSDTTFAQVFMASFGNLLLAFLVKFVAGLASSLSAGGFNFGASRGVTHAANVMRDSARGTARDFRGIRSIDQIGGAALGRMGSAFRSNSMRKAG